MSIAALVSARTRASFDSAKPGAISELQRFFPPTDWGIEFTCNTYTNENVNNLWDNELRSQVRQKLEDAGKGVNNYGAWLQEVHFISVEIYWKGLFPSGYQKNIGWRILLLAVPVAGVVTCGIASHYQNAQAHNKLALASNLLFEVAQEALKKRDDVPSLPGRQVTADDFDRTGLIRTPIVDVAGIDIRDVAPGGLDIKGVRTTTIKKIIASFISVEVPPLHFRELELAARYLAQSVYPFSDRKQFEEFRALAYQDLAAAQMRIQLRTSSSSRSIVRIYYGPPGTGKTLYAVRDAVTLADPTFKPADKTTEMQEAFTRFNELHGQVAFITFHQSLQYEDVVESIRPLVAPTAEEARLTGGTASDDESLDESQVESQDGSDEEAANKLSYYIYQGPVMKMIRRALEHPESEHVLVIDEINRGDISRILGPLISAIEPDKRAGADFPIGFESQYPRAPDLESRIFMPSNLHIIGTMNSADRNIALVDYALRRRFDFVECPPDASLLTSTQNAEPIDVKTLLLALNERIQYLLDRDHCIGHGYFMNCKANIEVIERFARRVLPLLAEYFYGNETYLLLAVGDRVGGNNNIFRIEREEETFERVFGLGLDSAVDMGYRAQETRLSISVDKRFWNPAKVPPSPDDEAYAVRAIKKIYESTTTSSVRAVRGLEDNGPSK